MKKRSLFGRLLVGSLTLILLLSAGFLASFPTLISTQMGKERILQFLNEQLNGSIKIEKLHLCWFGEQKIEGFSLKGADNVDVLSFESLSTKTSLSRLLFSWKKLGETTLIAPHLNLIEDQTGRYNLALALSRKSEKGREDKKGASRRLHLPSHLRVERGVLVIKTPKTETLTVGDIEIKKEGNPSLFYLSAKTLQNQIEGAILVNASAEKGNLQVSADIHELPTALFDQISGTSLFSSAVGPTLNCKLSLDEKANRYFLSTQMKSANLNGELTGVATNATFAFDANSKLLFNLTPAFFSKAFPQESWKLANKPAIVLGVKELKIPPRLLSHFDFEELESFCFPFSAEVLLPKTDLVHNTFGNLAIKEGKINFTGNHALEISYSASLESGAGLSSVAGNVKCERSGKYAFYSNNKDVPTPLIELLISDGTELTDIIGTRFDFNTTGIIDKGGLDANFALSTKSLLLEGDIQGDSFETIAMSGKGKFILPPAISSFLGASADFLFESELAYFDRHLSAPLINLKVKNPSLALELKGVLGKKGKCFRYQDVDLLAKGSLSPQQSKFYDHGSLFAHVNGAKNEISGEFLLSSFRDPTKEVAAHLKIENFYQEEGLNFNKALFDFDAKSEALPTLYLVGFLEEKVPLNLLLGESLRLNLKGNYKDNKASAAFESSGDGFQMNVNLLYDVGSQKVKAEPFEILWHLTDERYKTLYHYLTHGKKSRFSLAQSAQGKVEIKSLSFPTYQTQNPLHFISESRLDALFSFSPLLFEEIESKRTLSLENLQGKIDGENVKKAFNFSLDFLVKSPEIPQENISQVNLNGEIHDLISPEGHLNFPKMRADVDLKVDLLPVKLVTSLFPFKTPAKRRIDALLGDLVNAHIKGEFADERGPFLLDIRASNLKVELPIYYDNGLITLTKTVGAELTFTPEVNEVFLKDMSPLFIEGAYSDHPIRLFIDKEGFSLPVMPFSLEGVHIEKAVLDFGKIQVKNGKQIQDVMKFLKVTHLSPGGEMQAWFSPIFINLKEGVLSYKRFDILLGGKVHIALWGAIDMIKDRVKMVLGISPKNLRLRLNVIGLSKKEMFQVKMRGTTSELDLDWSSAYTRLGILLTRTAGGPIGYLAGGILEQFMSFGEEPTPPPTTSPFPWEEKGETSSPEGMPDESPPPAPSSKAGVKKLLEFLIP